MREKIAFVVARYGLEISGGAELHCRQLAEKMRAFYDVEIYTTCALDYLTWENYYRPGTEEVRGIPVHRFPVKRPRGTVELPSSFSIGEKEQLRWMEDWGPLCPSLIREIQKKHADYKAVIFMTYMYYPAAMGLTCGIDNAYLIPTIHDEPIAYVPFYDKVFAGAKGIIWNSPAERAFAERRFPHIKGKPGIFAGVGVDVPEDLPEIPSELKGAPYIVYAGRIDAGKGCGEMFQYFRRYKEQHGGDLKLALVGKGAMEIPKAEDIVELGFVPDEVKFAVMGSAKVLVLFSQFESLSMVVLESLTMGRPVLVNGKCAVLKDHCLRSNAGLYFENYPEFSACLDYFLTHDREYEVMRKNSVAYVRKNYQWDDIVRRIAGLIEQE